MDKINSIPDLEALYGTPGAASLEKVADHLTPLYRKWIMASRLCILSTVGPEGTDGSPRGDDGPVVQELTPRRLALPDWRGNQRLDTLRNIVKDGRISLLFMVPGSNNVVRVNGTAWLTADAALRENFEKKGRQPATVIIIDIEEVYSQCARALMRAGTWAGRDESNGLPTVGEILAEVSQGAEGGAQYDAEWAPRAAKTMW
ncbi:pyridoxamine 5'-phosphate oxidase family protein [Sulfitobacter donghicola]|uniref:Pyridoxamine 5'-phosphate oxidase n=1 Tax=Sulfitobacter donghicola DSW-25 = KCTC 12864 = JCM 14565 TaxID=1300350 RepID=A0A073IWH5_9RHOB|nr:pyridoxamine 5'-phosphate oxidase family protein [Sulfitobacter donghicola]KEJ89732.1 pyridoxamine 5'-phosphate oxidase [Sulfitobacter donghicola DSW-25 = KCTC 12864 = JCM 14565]KIN67172.1 Pyridoxamine 5'-phosphate oxidase family protein [Sulfitobacter donghicola DSW-25 = KCTC 12864 = JCM 14565]